MNSIIYRITMDTLRNLLIVLFVIAVLIFIIYLLREWILMGVIALFVIAAIYNSAS